MCKKQSECKLENMFYLEIYNFSEKIEKKIIKRIPLVFCEQVPRKIYLAA